MIRTTLGVPCFHIFIRLINFNPLFSVSNLNKRCRLQNTCNKSRHIICKEWRNEMLLSETQKPSYSTYLLARCQPLSGLLSVRVGRNQTKTSVRRTSSLVDSWCGTFNKWGKDGGEEGHTAARRMAWSWRGFNQSPENILWVLTVSGWR